MQPDVLLRLLTGSHSLLNMYTLGFPGPVASFSPLSSECSNCPPPRSTHVLRIDGNVTLPQEAAYALPPVISVCDFPSFTQTHGFIATSSGSLHSTYLALLP